MSLSFSTKRVELEVSIDEAKHFIKEASGKTAVEYQNLALNGVTFGADGKPQRMVGQASVQLLLVGQCLHACDPSGAAYKNPVGQKWVEENLPAKVLKTLFEKIKEISNLGEKETEESLNKQMKKLQDKLLEIQTDPSGE
jgi:hypothetical protein